MNVSLAWRPQTHEPTRLEKEIASLRSQVDSLKSEMQGINRDIPLIKEALARSFIAIPGSRRSVIPTIEGVARTVAHYYGITLQDIMSGRRAEPTALARMMTYVVARRLTSMSNYRIARSLKRDHTTIGDSLRRFEVQSKEQPYLVAEAEKLEALVMATLLAGDAP